ncbi:hypothetical protein [Malikia granosa]|uniref:Nitrogen fixation protein FixH n=1 Tax=Malikia granosa TaxID=263067 RepID=A0A2S9K7U7_9BURK|nr:hypothetical protein [Malikia granosa]PRD66508.1 hypothetical protein C6P64_04300 [Malikia granosa]
MEQKKLKDQAWYREPMMWLVVGGPLLVVCASITTYMIATSRPDPVLERDAAAEAQRVGKSLTPEQRESLEPALKVRNHVASPRVPADK